MRVLIVFVLTVFVFVASVDAQDISNLLMDRNYVQKQINCILNRGHCDLIGRKIKGLLPEALNNNCRRCTYRQMEHARTLIGFMKRNYPREWHSIVGSYGAMQHA
ncbi:ejaculatory bulb-specific protein 3-like [Hylaeus anthracinus]|uniref:ejaculatory bulb-specific protein 3-like n=1 Tax=Hylaeus anthracinus TaxID=313031 RepID=UPI0023B9F42A|nr:ejaculatory bulb-specific protein 3-like [Hylaeus anthracinus]